MEPEIQHTLVAAKSDIRLSTAVVMEYIASEAAVHGRFSITSTLYHIKIMVPCPPRPFVRPKRFKILSGPDYDLSQKPGASVLFLPTSMVRSRPRRTPIPSINPSSTDRALRMPIVKSLHHRTSVCERSRDDADVHQLVAGAKEIKPPRKPPLRELRTPTRRISIYATLYHNPLIRTRGRLTFNP